MYIKPKIHTPTPHPKPQNTNFRTLYEKAFDIQSNNVSKIFIMVISTQNMVLLARSPPPHPPVSINKPIIINTLYHNITFQSISELSCNLAAFCSSRKSSNKPAHCHCNLSSKSYISFLGNVSILHV